MHRVADMHRVAARKQKISALAELPAAANSPANSTNTTTTARGVTPSTERVTNEEEPYNLRIRGCVGVAASVTATTWQTPQRRESRERGSTQASDDLSSDDDLVGSDKENDASPQLPFAAMKPVNILISLEMLMTAFGEVSICPSRALNKNTTTSTLELEHYQFGLTAEIYINCKHGMAIHFLCLVGIHLHIVL